MKFSGDNEKKEGGFEVNLSNAALREVLCVSGCEV